MDITFLIIGILIGSILVWFCLRYSLAHAVRRLKENESELASLRTTCEQERVSRVTAETKLHEAKNNLQQQKKLLEEATAKLSDTFSALSKNALSSNNELFLNLAKANLEKIIAEGKGDFTRKQEAIDGLVKPLQQALKSYDEQIRRLEENRQKAYGSLENQLKHLTETHQQLQKETGNLVTALRVPNVRGRWGEITLRRVVELAGMSEHCDFTEQQTTEDEGKRSRPDMVVSLPNERSIVVDSKVPLQAYIDALSSSDEPKRQECMKRHARQVADHMKKLSKKSYWDQFSRTPEFVVMFIPGESFFSAAVDIDKGLIEDGIQQRVILATPTTLIALLRSIAYGWRQEQITKNALTIRDLGNKIHERLVMFVRNFSKIGSSLENTVEAYNKSVGTLEARVLVSARKLKELGITEKEPIEDVEQIEKLPRAVETSSDND